MARLKAMLTFLGGASSGVICSYYLSFAKENQNVHVEYEEPKKDDATQNKKLRGQEILKYGQPLRAPDASYYSNHVLCYDQALKIPLWVAEHLTEENLKGDANRRHSKFQPDPDWEPRFSAENTDYFKSGWSRGHMAPAGNNKGSQDAMHESFYLTNILPQDLNNNGYFWNKFEIYCRDLTKKFKNVRVVSGPVMMPNSEEEDKLYIKYQVIGKNKVAVPTHLYKVVVVDNGEEPVGLGAFIVPNCPISREHTLKEYQVPLETVEDRTGFYFVPEVERSRVENLCKVDQCELMDHNTFELYFIHRKLGSARTLHRLETVWRELEEKQLEPDQQVLDLYHSKKQQLEAKEASKQQAAAR